MPLQMPTQETKWSHCLPVARKKITRELAWPRRDKQERHCVALYTPTHKHDTSDQTWLN